MNTSARKPSALQRVVSDPVSRRRFLALTGGTTAGGTLLAACGNDDDEGDATAATTEDDMASQFGEGDLGIVNYALTLEYLEAAFYADVAKSGLFKGDDLALIERIGRAEQEHVDALTAAAKQLGGQPAAEPKAEFPLDDAKSVLELAATVENLGAAAYLGQARGDLRPGDPRRGALDPLGGGAPRGGAQHPRRHAPHAGRRVRAGGRHADRARRGPAVHHLTKEKGSSDAEGQRSPRARSDRGRGELQPLGAAVRGALAAGALYGAMAVTPLIRKAFAQGSMGDIDILNFALTLEYLEAAFYEEAAGVKGLTSEVAGYVKTFGDEEQEHVDALTATIRDLGHARRGARRGLRRRVLERRQVHRARHHPRGHRRQRL